MSNSTGPNHLVGEKSPYLIKHANNPVDWYPWGEEAFSEARRTGRPIFLSIGYSSCHWCHVMERESFEDEDVAKVLNEDFVSIKVDREERPDIDELYMKACQTMTGGGGWPLTIVMTPEKIPFFAATYLPRTGMLGMADIITILEAISNAWKNERSEVEEITSTIMKAIESMQIVQEGEPSLDMLDKAFSGLKKTYEDKFGGFEKTPKFPIPHKSIFLLRFWHDTGNKEALDMATWTLDNMMLGGIRDHVGGGFHRYSTDMEWILPHFEKMLYDQALISMAYTEAYQATGNDQYRKVAIEIIEYVMRVLATENGGICSSEDADSEGIEGKFYLWSSVEIRELLRDLGPDRFLSCYDVREEGNMGRSSEGEGDINLLHLIGDLPTLATKFDMSPFELDEYLTSCQNVLRKARDDRVRPAKDDKVLTDWNGLMIAALAKAGRVFGIDSMTQAAKRAADFIESRMATQDRGLCHMYRDGEVRVNGLLSDHAYYIWGLLELYQTTFEQRYLIRAREYTERVLDLFSDETGGFYNSVAREDLTILSKETSDGAIPSPNSVMVYDLAILSEILMDQRMKEAALRSSRHFHFYLSKVPDALSFFMIGIRALIRPCERVVITGNPVDPRMRAMISTMAMTYHPYAITLWNPYHGGLVSECKDLAHVRDMTPIDGVPTAYVCSEGTCKRPTTDVGEMLSLLSRKF